MLKTCLAVAILFISSSLFGAEFQCPKEIRTDQKWIDSASGWRVFHDKVNENHFLQNIGLYDGPPEGLASLVPDNENAPDTVGSEWTLRPMASRRVWAVCRYHDTSIELSRELPVEVRKCTVIKSKGPVPGIESLHCE